MNNEREIIDGLSDDDFIAGGNFAVYASAIVIGIILSLTIIKYIY